MGKESAMKRFGNLFDKICDFNNLIKSTHLAVRGKKNRMDVSAFYFNMEFEIIQLQEELFTENYKPIPYESFYVYEPKKRHICKAGFRDRVLHHAICRILEPIFEQKFIYDSYACRKKKGHHKAVLQVQKSSRGTEYFLKADIHKFFASVDHSILKRLLCRIIKDRKVLRLMEIIIDHPIPEHIRGKGLAIGNLTSQWWANFYLNSLDHYIKDELGVKRYFRYMDDFVLLDDNKEKLQDFLQKISEYLEINLCLKLKNNATFIAPIQQGIPFLGFRIFPYLIRLKRTNLVRFRRKFRQKEKAYLNGKISEDTFIRSVSSMIGHIKHANTYQMRQDFFWGKY
jgi:retron-type reverse transcriptase